MKADSIRFSFQIPIAARVRQFAAATRQLARAALPGQCALCGNLSQALLCGGCDAQYWNEQRLRCATCALPLAASYLRREREDVRAHCTACLEAPPAFNDTLALADYRAPLDTLAVELKFRARLAAGAEFARHLHRVFEDSGLPRPDVIVPVPLSRPRLIARGYNQAWAIAQPLARRLGVRSDASLIARVRHTSAQSRLDLDTRRRNVANAFAISGDVRGRHIGVVDDVMTSGATLDALARAFKFAGARRVTNFVALRTPKD
ncbi:ComF family protein [Caballeronia insecticola]|uniref:Putative competence protein f-related protein n=1 Tax=Caballeronia insecticola TaxID=758793 RepID=R4WVM9_9BURK|nr:putative competence protein f-related protein [Caballeronia insecticola]